MRMLIDTNVILDIYLIEKTVMSVQNYLGKWGNWV